MRSTIVTDASTTGEFLRRMPLWKGTAALGSVGALTLAGACAPPAPRASDSERATYALHGARILDVAAGTYSAPSVVLVRDGRITRTLRQSEYHEGLADSTVDIRGAYLLPGLIDAHVHLGIGGPPRASALADVRAGFTTVVDLGARTHAIPRVRDSVAAGSIPGPRVLAAGIWVGIQNGVCEFNGIGIADGADGFRRRIRQNVLAGADIIKLCVSGWPAEAFANPERYEVADSILVAGVAAAHEQKKLVVAHAISRGSVQAALRAGVDGLAHAAFVDSAIAAEMAEKRVFMISTLASLTAGDTSAAARALVAAIGLAHRLGVTIVAGTDGGVLPHGRNAEELLALRAAGLSPIDVIRAATTDAAVAFRLADSVGALRPGMIADVVVVSGDPLLDLSTFQLPRLVMARGKIVPR